MHPGIQDPYFSKIQKTCHEENMCAETFFWHFLIEKQFLAKVKIFSKGHILKSSFLGHNVKIGLFFQMFEAFSENMNFDYLAIHRHQFNHTSFP